jgi:hypothetical protein
MRDQAHRGFLPRPLYPVSDMYSAPRSMLDTGGMGADSSD